MNANEKILDYEDDLQQDEQTNPISFMLPPANQIITKSCSTYDQKVSFKVESIKQNIESSQLKAPYLPQTKPIEKVQSKENTKKQVSSNKKSNKKQSDVLTIQSNYSNCPLIFKKYDNTNCCTRNQINYPASIFVSMISGKSKNLPQYKGMLCDDQLIFDSNFESGNLMAVYKIAPNIYDLILQNDVNTGGFTQWYNFKVKNKAHNFIAKFNIVNLYKSSSLYNIGMKPIVFSQKSNRNQEKVWRRKGFNIYYQQNDLVTQQNMDKRLHTISFQYDFTIQNDTTQFAHAMPYDLIDLQKMLDSIKVNAKVSLKSVGTTIMGRQIPLICINSSVQKDTPQKKVIVILARQHPGQTPGSHICQEVVYELLKASTQTDFLLWRFDIHIIPMVNLDGVFLGNYRGNFAGYDLNRCWIRTDSYKQPQVYAIKNYVRKLSKKQAIELILDLHGHSRKMGSFFYGNTYGKNMMLFPYICSKTTQNIVFEKCKFSKERAQKSATARVVLGSLIQQTGNVYTYQTSFFGNYKNAQQKSNPFSFHQKHYKQLGKALVLSMYRTYMQVYKQQKTLKESVYLKAINKQIGQIKQVLQTSLFEQEGSDSQAQEIIRVQQQQSEQYFGGQQVMISPGKLDKDDENDTNHKNHNLGMYKGDSKTLVDRNNSYIQQKISQLLDKRRNHQDYNQRKECILPRLPENNSKEQQQKKQQNYLNQRLDKSLQIDPDDVHYHRRQHGLKIYGQTFQLKKRKMNNSEISMLSRHQQLIQNIQRAHKNIQSSNSRPQVTKRHAVMRSFNTIDLNSSNTIQPQQLYRNRASPGMVKKRGRNHSLTLKEVSPIFDNMLTSDAVKINKIDVIKTKQIQNPMILIAQHMKNNFKLPSI